MMSRVEVSILILNYNGKKFLTQCLDSVLHQSYTNFEIIIFDNASTDGSVQFVKKFYEIDKIKLVESKTNLGFAGGNNEGIKYCSGEFIVLLNNDTVVEYNCYQD